MDTPPGGARTLFAGGGRIYSFNNINAAATTVVVAAVPQRQQIIFHNPGSNPLYAAPTKVQNGGSDSVLLPTASALGGCLLIAPGTSLVITGNAAQQSWQVFALTGPTNPLTVLDTNAI